jgi:mannose-6-phosphate isomerase-like protein (cupin superfamily)
MVKRNASYEVLRRERMRDGDGVVVIENLLTPAQLYDKGRLFAKLSLEPGSSIGYHVHEGEMESFYIIGGEAEYNDNGQTVTLLPGDTALTQSGEGHSIKSIGNTPLELLALILIK